MAERAAILWAGDVRRGSVDGVIDGMIERRMTELLGKSQVIMLHQLLLPTRAYSLKRPSTPAEQRHAEVQVQRLCLLMSNWAGA